MTEKEFKKYMQRGLGRCVIELKSGKNIAKYREAILHCCLNNPSFDTQCEGTRSEYLYELVSYYDDADYFLIPVIEKFKNSRNDGWEFAHMCDFISQFAYDGNPIARKVLWEKYNEIYAKLLDKNFNGGYDFNRDNFETLGISLTSLDGLDAFLKIAADMGRLFEENDRYCAEDFEWFYVNYKNKAENEDVNGILARESETSHHVKVFYEAMRKLNREQFKESSIPSTVPTAEDIVNAATKKDLRTLTIQFRRKASDEEKLKVAKMIIDEPDYGKKAEMLQVFRMDGFPSDHRILITYTTSPNKKLQKIAWEILSDCKSDEVRNFALNLIERGSHFTDAVCMLISNYRDEDKNLLLKLLHSYRITYSDNNGWHSAVGSILDAFDDGVKLPVEFLEFIYEKSLCSCCREYAVRRMAKQGWLTEDIRQECLYDSNYDIREFAETLQ